MPPMWEVGTFCTRVGEAAMTWSDAIPTEEEGEATRCAS